MTFPRALQGVSGKAAATAHSLMAETTGLSTPTPNRECPETR